MFIVTLTYRDPASAAALEGAHREFLRGQHASGLYLMSGPIRPDGGELIIASAESRAEVELALERDPVVAAGLAEHHIIEFLPTATADAFAPFRED